MARIATPDGRPDIETIWGVVPDLGAAIGGLSGALYDHDTRILPARVRSSAIKFNTKTNSRCRGLSGPCRMQPLPN